MAQIVHGATGIHLNVLHYLLVFITKMKIWVVHVHHVLPTTQLLYINGWIRKLKLSQLKILEWINKITREDDEEDSEKKSSWNFLFMSVLCIVQSLFHTGSGWSSWTATNSLSSRLALNNFEEFEPLFVNFDGNSLLEFPLKQRFTQFWVT